MLAENLRIRLAWAAKRHLSPSLAMSSAFPPAKSRPLRVRPVQQDTVACKVCGEDAPLFGVHDFNRCCEEARGTVLPPCGVAVYYRRCATCGLLFTDSFDDWSAEDFATHIYNDQCGHVDWDFEAVRAARQRRADLPILP